MEEEVWEIEYLSKSMTIDEIIDIVRAIIFHEDVTYFGSEEFPEKTDWCMN